MKEEIITWRDVFDSYKVFGIYGWIGDFLPFLRTTGYKYFNWNGRIYKVNDDCTEYFDMGFRASDLDEQIKSN